MIDPARVRRYRSVLTRSVDPSSTPSERETAKRVCANMEAKYPDIEFYAAQPEPEAAPPHPEPPKGPPRQEGPPKSDWKGTLRDWFTETVGQVSRGLSLSDRIDDDVIVEIHANKRTVHVHVKIPLEDALDAADDAGGSLQEYARLIGLKVGQELAQAFEDSGY